MIERGSRLRLTKEPLFVFLVFEDVGAQEFQSNGAAELGVLGFVDHPHPTFAELRGYVVGANRVADQDAPILLFRFRL